MGLLPLFFLYMQCLILDFVTDEKGEENMQKSDNSAVAAPHNCNYKNDCLQLVWCKNSGIHFVLLLGLYIIHLLFSHISDSLLHYYMPITNIYLLISKKTLYLVEIGDI